MASMLLVTRQMLHQGKRNIGTTALQRSKDKKCIPQYEQECSPPPFQAPCPRVPDCKACKPINPNPCMPVCVPKQGSYVKYQLLTFVMLCCVGYQAVQVADHIAHHEPKMCCVDYEYMFIRTKRFPWGNGDKSLFHNDKLNCLPAAVRDKY